MIRRTASVALVAHVLDQLRGRPTPGQEREVVSSRREKRTEKQVNVIHELRTGLQLESPNKQRGSQLKAARIERLQAEIRYAYIFCAPLGVHRATGLSTSTLDLLWIGPSISFLDWS